MNYRSPTFFRSLARAGLALCILSVAAVQAETRVIKDAGFAVPESVEYYQGEDVYFVSNVKGHPLEPAANGFISKLSPEGKVLDLQWLASDPARYTFHAPKGLAIAGSHLYVADLEEVHVFELPQGKHLRSIPIDGASVLNGISPASEDSVIVVDTGYVKSDEGIAPSQTDALYRVWSDGRYELIASDVAMGNPNGVFFAGKDEILVVTFGSSELFQLNLKGERVNLPQPPLGTLDGVEKLPDGRIVVSSWEGDAIYALNTDGTYSTVLDSIDDPADLGFDSKRNRLLIPLTNSDQVVIHDLNQ